MIINTHFGSSVVYILHLCHCHARLNSGEKIDRVYYFHLLIRFCFATASSMFHLLIYQLICVCMCVIQCLRPRFCSELCAGDAQTGTEPLTPVSFGRSHWARGFSSVKTFKWGVNGAGLGCAIQQELHCWAPWIREPTQKDLWIIYKSLNPSGFHLSFCLPIYCRCC